MELNNTVVELFQSEQPERHFAMPGSDEGNAFPNENWYDGDDEFVNRVLVKEGPDYLPSAHHPDVLARFLAKAFRKRPNGLLHKFDAGRQGCRGRLPRKHIMHVVCAEGRLHFYTQIVGLATEYLGVDRA